ncbi:MAG: leucyl aminopeptidase [Thermostichales cyanobacterium HHBFW_bins_127]
MSLALELVPTPLETWEGECLLLLQTATPEWQLPQPLRDWDQQRWQGLLQETIQETQFTAKAQTTCAVRLPGPIRKLILVGLGDNPTLETLRRAVGTGLRQANSLKAKQVAISLPEPFRDPQGVRAVAEACYLTAHQDTRFKSPSPDSDKSFQVSSISLLAISPQPALTVALTQAQEIAAGVILARELVNAPANIVTPVTLAETARQLAQTYGLEVEVLGQAECEALGMGAFLGVAKASDLPPQFIHLTYKPTGESRGKLALIGKGLTFDSGGLNIKTDTRSIAMMKTDMGGAAAVLGTARAIARLGIPLEVHFLVAATENMISGRALHPGDILTASNQKTIEINNTDAEGRLTLADALVFAEKLEVDAIVDLATLTGACVIALGSEIAGLFTPDETLATELLAASHSSGEKIWRMPLEESYNEGLSSLVADLKNTGPREGGAITAALFLKNFVHKTPWAHIDIAAPVWTEREGGYTNKGATGYGVRLLCQWLLNRANQN